MSESPSSEQRSKRRKIDKNGRIAALERLRNLKGSKHKYEVDTVKNVYDVVDESEYVKTVNARVDDDWIDDDGGSGYVDDGREIFDDDELEPSSNTSKNSKKRPRDETQPAKGKKSLKNFFKAAEETKVKISDDDALADILGEIGSNENEAAQKIEIKPVVVSRKTPKLKESTEEDVQKYMEKISKNLKKSEKPKDADDEMLDRLIHKNQEKEKPKANVKEEAKTVEDEFDLSGLNDDFFDEDDDLIAQAITQPVVKPAVRFEAKKEKIDPNFVSGWENISELDLGDEFEDETESQMDVSIKNDEESIKIWYWDAWTDPNKCPGEIYLFGKMPGPKKGEYQSVCIHIQSVDRVMFMLPRKKEIDLRTNQETDKDVSMMEVYREFESEIAGKLRIKAHKTRYVTKNYAYVTEIKGVDVPLVSDYMEVRYDARQPAISNEKKYRTISHIFGTNASILETFLLEKKIKGPCWMEIKNFQKVQNGPTWCKVHYNVPNRTSIIISSETAPPPPMIVCTLNIKCVSNEKSKHNEIVMISALVKERFFVNKPAPQPPEKPFNKHFCALTRPANTTWPISFDASKYQKTTIKRCENEKQLLDWFLNEYVQIDPDLVVTHDIYNFNLDLLCSRMISLKVGNWSRIGRLKTHHMTSKKIDDFFVGRLVCDLKHSAEELIKSRSYDLNTLCQEILKMKEGERKDIQIDDIPDMYSTPERLFQFVGITMHDSYCILKLMYDLNVIPLALQITQIAGNLMNRTLRGGRAERNEYLLLHAFTEKDYILPDKIVKNFNEMNTQRTKTKSKATYAGGLVLDPIKGFYDKYILLMDFNSLYPSIIQEYNICFTTVLPPDGEDGEPSFVDTTETGILPRQIRKLVDNRRAVKQLMKKPGLDADLKMQYNIRQLALKLTANSLYGCLGFQASRFYAQHLAALITQKGREILMNTKSIVEGLNYKVIYGDTDSIMINTNILDYDQVWKIGSSIKQVINKTYKCLELDIDGVYKYLLLLKKKKYAAVTVSKVGDKFEETKEYKGLDIVRRDWSKISVVAGEKVLEILLTSEKPMDERIEDIHTFLEELKVKIKNGETRLQMLEITKQLTKNLKDYTEKNLPHVMVAQRMNKERKRNFKKNDMINYIICLDGTSEAAIKRAYHIDEIQDPKNKEKLEVDIEYYLAHQIHPVVSRLCEPIEGTDSYRLALSLGLDGKKYQNVVATNENREDEGKFTNNLKRFRMCHTFDFVCVKCRVKNVVAAAFKKEKGKFVPIFTRCANEKCEYKPYQYLPSIKNQIVLAIRDDIKRFYQNWMICDNPKCGKNTRFLTHVGPEGKPICFKCRTGLLSRQFSEEDLYQQLLYYRHMFDLTDYERTPGLTDEIRHVYSSLKEIVGRFMKLSKYGTIDLGSIYGRGKYTQKLVAIHPDRYNDLKTEDG